MKKRFIIVPITALATLGLSSSVILANSKVSLINDKVYIEEGADLDVDWDALKKVSANSVGVKEDSSPEPTSTPDIQWTRRGGISVIQGTVLTEAILQLPSNIHLNDVPYVCDIVGSFDIRLIAVDDTNNTAGELLYQINVFPAQTQAPTATPTQTPTTTPTYVATKTPTPSALPASVVTNSSTDSTLNLMQTGSKTVDIACGSRLTLASLGLDTSGRFTYEYDEDVFDETYDELETFDTVVKVTDTVTNTTSSINFTIKVVDKTAPTLKGVKSTIKIVGGKNVVARIKKGVSAKDNIDGTIAKSRIKISGYKAKKYDKYQKVTFTVKDKAGNTTTKTVKLKITNPVKKLNKTMYVKASTLNVRSSSSAKGKKLGTLKFGNKIKVIGQDRNTGWYKIKYKGKTGWVNKSYVSTKKPSKPVSKKKKSSDSSMNGIPGSNKNADASNCNCNCSSDCTDRSTLECWSVCDCVSEGW